jgi:hypothetical protein
MTAAIDPQTIDPQTSVSMLLPSALVELPLKSAIELAMNDEIADCADPALVEDVVPEELEVLPRALIRL